MARTREWGEGVCLVAGSAGGVVFGWGVLGQFVNVNRTAGNFEGISTGVGHDDFFGHGRYTDVLWVGGGLLPFTLEQ